jgi:uncharacterized protein (TIRG00374 family)
VQVSYLKFLYLALGVALLVVVVTQIDVGEVLRQTVQIGWGMAIILGLHCLSFLADAFAWQITLLSVPLDRRWLYRLWKVRMVGETFNVVIPAAGLGGEPLKAVLLKRHYGIDYREGIASLILSQTIIVIALVIFLVGGFVFMLRAPALPWPLDVVAGIGLAGIILGIVLIVALQHFRLTSILGVRLKRWRIGQRIEAVLHHVRDVEERLIVFYVHRRARFAAALVFSFIPWLIGVPEIYYAAAFLGHPISFADAWIIEAAVQMIRTGLSVVPAGLGAQEGIFLVFFSLLTGTPTLGASVALVRRVRELVWVLWGAAVGLTFFFLRTFPGRRS